MASRCGEESGATAFCSESSREGTNVLVVKGTTHTGMKDIRTKASVITIASLGVGQFKKSLEKNWNKKDEQFDGSAVLWQYSCR